MSRTLWTSAEMAEILHDAAAIDADPTLRVTSDGTPTRHPGHWELMRLDQRALILAGDVYLG